MVTQDEGTNRAAHVLDFEDQSRSYARGGPNRKDSAGAADDGMEDILDILNSEHRYLATLLDRLEQEAGRLRPGRIPDYHLLLDIIDYLTHYPDQYHHPREDLLFSTMVEHDDGFAPALERLEREHRALKAYNHDLFAELTAIATGRPVDRPELLRSIGDYLAAYRQHMDFEYREIFPRARGRLSAANRKKLGRKTQYIDDPLFGGEVQYRYRRLGRDLQVRVEAAGQELAIRELSAIQSTIGGLSTALDKVGKLRTALARQWDDSRREQQETIRECLRSPGRGPRVMRLPFELAKLRSRQWREGIAEIRQIMSESGEKNNADRN